MPGRWRVGPALVLAALAGCATPYGEGHQALGRGDYDTAARRFEQALADEPGRTDALTGLGIARYRQRAWDAAIEALEQALGNAPNDNDADARLYLALSHLQKGEIEPALDQLTALRRLELDPRFAEQLDRATHIIRAGPLPDEVRSFVAASLESQAQLLRELRLAELEAQRARALTPPPPCTLVNRNGALYCL